MIKFFRGNNIKDTETAQETIISNLGLTNNINKGISSYKTLKISDQSVNDDNFDNSIEKRNKKS